MRKTRLSGILDTSSYGFTIGDIEMEITKPAVTRLMKLCRNSEWLRGSISLDQMSVIKLMEPSTGAVQNGADDENPTEKDQVYATYFIKERNGKQFLNVTGNPTKMMAGYNSVPVLLTDKHYADNAAMNTFQYANRILFAILEYVPVRDERYRFIWPKEDRERLQCGDINVSQLQIAWYSGDLGNHRDATLKLIRAMYIGLKTNTGYSLTDDLNMRTTAWGKNFNLTLECMSGNNKELALTLYAKDKEQGFNGDQKETQRLQKLIRFDCTFRNHFLTRKKLKTVKLIEETYQTLCDAKGYDTGFVTWLHSVVKKRIHLDYLMTIQHKEYLEGMDKMREIVTAKKKYACLAQWWLNDSKPFFETKEEIATYLGYHYNYHNAHVDDILYETGINVNVPRSYHSQILDNRISLVLTPEEYERIKIDYTSNDVPSLRAQAIRSDSFMKTISASFGEGGVLRVRRLAPKKMKSADFHIRKLFRGELSSGKSETSIQSVKNRFEA